MKAFERLWIGIFSLSLLAFSFQTASAEPVSYTHLTLPTNDRV